LNSPADLTYGRYLRLDDLLSAQQPLTESHDELLFVIIHQVYELWFKQILHEAALLQARLEGGDSAGALATAHRIAKILKTVVGQLDILETMTPRQFAAFRPELGSSSGFQSAQFRYLEAGWPVPAPVLERDPVQPWPGDQAGQQESVQDLLLGVYAEAGTAAEVCEALVDIDEGVQEWRYRHVKMVERIIGIKAGTGGSAGSDYLRTTLFRSAFPDLWAIRSRL
jgi:tryptophan 2,3-dioxygenase